MNELDRAITDRANALMDALKRIEMLGAELERLCGPVCEQDQKRAIEHHLRRHGGGVAVWVYVDITDHSCTAAHERPQRTHAGACWYCGEQIVNARQEAVHKPTPEIEAWLRERAK